jgi:hypothetical protein
MPHDSSGDEHGPKPAGLPAVPEGSDEDFPWSAGDAPADPDAPRERHDAFNQVRRAKFLKALVKTGCIAEACRRTGTAPRTVYNHQQSDAAFLAYCTTAMRMAATPLEITAWGRAVDGVEETVVVGGRAVTRTRYSEHLLRLLLQASDPKRFGRNPGFTPKRMRAAEREAIEKEARREEREKNWKEFTKMVDRAMAKRQAKTAASAEEAEAEAEEQESLDEGDGEDEAGASGGV